MAVDLRRLRVGSQNDVEINSGIAAMDSHGEGGGEEVGALPLGRGKASLAQKFKMGLDMPTGLLGPR